MKEQHMYKYIDQLDFNTKYVSSPLETILIRKLRKKKRGG